MNDQAIGGGRSFTDLFKPKAPAAPTMVMPDGEIEKDWSEEQIKTFMQHYLSMNDLSENRKQNKKNWDYDLWFFAITKYADGLSLNNIAKLAMEYYDAVRLSRNPKQFISSIIHHKGWHLGHRMRELIRNRRIEEIEDAKASAAMQAQADELDHLAELKIELAACVQSLSLYERHSPAYSSVLNSIKTLEGIVNRFSGSDMVKELQKFRAKEQYKASVQGDQSINPRTITPNLIG